jgi:hypothetical protein
VLLYCTVMKVLLWFAVAITFSSCASLHEDNRYGFLPGPGMSEDAQDFPDTRHNMMDSSDGSQDPNARLKVWGAVY